MYSICTMFENPEGGHAYPPLPTPMPAGVHYQVTITQLSFIGTQKERITRTLF